jgi:hypothetical protein
LRIRAPPPLPKQVTTYLVYFTTSGIERATTLLATKSATATTTPFEAGSEGEQAGRPPVIARRREREKSLPPHDIENGCYTVPGLNGLLTLKPGFALSPRARSSTSNIKVTAFTRSSCSAHARNRQQQQQRHTYVYFPWSCRR